MAILNPLTKKTLSLIAYIGLGVAFAFYMVQKQPPTLVVGTNAPIDEKITLLSGRLTTFKSLLKKPMIVNFWATWCPPCIKELPLLSKAFRNNKDNILFVGATVSGNKDDVLAFKTKYLIDYELGFVGDQVVDVFLGRVLPTTYVLDTQGKILWAHAGGLTEELLNEAVKAALAP